MKRIRIGNDIRVQTTLHELTDFDATMIKQLRCYFIPESDSNVNPFPQTYDPAQYNICNCGKPMYNVFPCNIDAPHWFPGYNGFGVNSTPFMSINKEYLAPSRLLAEQNKIEAYFPAVDQKLLGEYRVVIVLTLYQTGWGADNLRTYTIDKGVVFALTSNDQDIDTDTVIDLDTPYITSISIPSTLTLGTEQVFNIGESDHNDAVYNIQLHYSNGASKKVTPDEFSELFTVVVHGGPSAIAVGENGQINRIDKYSDVNTEITYLLKDNVTVNATIKVVSSGKWYNINYIYDSNYVTVDGETSVYIEDILKNGDANPITTFTATPTDDEYAMTSLDMEITGASLLNKPDPSSQVIKAEVTIETPVTSDEITVTITASEFRP